MNEFELNDNEYIPLCDLLKRQGMCETGGHAKIVISEGEVTVDGEVETRKRFKVRKGHTISFNNESVKVV